MNENKQPEFEPPLLRRAHLAVFFGAIIACASVAIIGMLGLWIWSIVSGGGSAPTYQSALDASYVFLSTLAATIFISAFNWYLFFVVIPISWIAIGFLSVIFKAEKRPQPARKFYLAGISATTLAIFLVSITGLLPYAATDYLLVAVCGAAVAALAVGIPAGFLTMFAYRVILRPPTYPAP